ncbi:acyl-CoA thioesterase [Burkholderia cenocepacia]|uniref:acyl-CoA thioesterase n=1 Tax=Burkholderia cenocepacia TaxID=95486 RepID=UPI002AB62F7C|nr:acyl-CoA thioesterase domain-containing protein [Burkholderia cenocepacia]
MSSLMMPTLADRLTLESAGAGCWRSRHGDANQNGRSYGGQLLGQAMRAALMEMPLERAPTMMQFLFLQGAMPEQPITYEVTRLQEGKRFTSLRVRGTQDVRSVLEAQVTCALALPGPAHGEASQAPPGECPMDLPTLEDVPPGLLERIGLMGGYGRDRNPAIAFRIPDVRRQLAGETAGKQFRYWMRVPQPLPDDPRVHAAAFAYLSDWWLNYCIFAPDLLRAGERDMYISSLNHTLWFHAVPRADCWVHVQATAAHAANGRGLVVAQYHLEDGRHLATAAQDSLVTYLD